MKDLKSQNCGYLNLLSFLFFGEERWEREREREKGGGERLCLVQMQETWSQRRASTYTLHEHNPNTLQISVLY